MKIFFSALFFLICFLFLLPITGASASGMHHHGVNSPFDGKKQVHIEHCDLNRHSLKDIVCPHMNAGENADKVLIASNCGGKTSENFPAFGSYNASVSLFSTTCFKIELTLINRNFTYLGRGFGLLLPNQIDHPPKTV